MILENQRRQLLSPDLKTATTDKKTISPKIDFEAADSLKREILKAQLKKGILSGSKPNEKVTTEMKNEQGILLREWYDRARGEGLMRESLKSVEAMHDDVLRELGDLVATDISFRNRMKCRSVEMLRTASMIGNRFTGDGETHVESIDSRIVNSTTASSGDTSRLGPDTGTSRTLPVRKSLKAMSSFVSLRSRVVPTDMAPQAAPTSLAASSCGNTTAKSTSYATK
jgi:hypothetical protein